MSFGVGLGNEVDNTGIVEVERVDVTGDMLAPRRHLGYKLLSESLFFVRDREGSPTVGI